MKRVVILVCALVVGIVSAKAWGSMGHAAIAYIAEQNLTPKARQMCHHYLKHTLPYYGSWMDHYRYVNYYNISHSWHGVAFDKDMNARSGKYKNCVDQISNMRRETKNYRMMQDSVVADNLRFLIHMVGDIHCPVHLFYPKTMPEYQQGKRYIDGKSMRMHGFIDSSPSYFHPKWGLVEFHRNLAPIYQKLKGKVSKGTAEEWLMQLAEESKELWHNFPNDSEWEALTEDKRQRVIQQLDRHIYIAGLRLAAVLNDVFAK